MAIIFKTELECGSGAVKPQVKQEVYVDLESTKFEENLIAALSDMFENSSVECRAQNRININLDSKIVGIDLRTLVVKCEEDEYLESIVTTVVKQIMALS